MHEKISREMKQLMQSCFAAATLGSVEIILAAMSRHGIDYVIKDLRNRVPVIIDESAKDEESYEGLLENLIDTYNRPRTKRGD